MVRRRRTRMRQPCTGGRMEAAGQRGGSEQCGFPTWRGPAGGHASQRQEVQVMATGSGSAAAPRFDGSTACAGRTSRRHRTTSTTCRAGCRPRPIPVRLSPAERLGDALLHGLALDGGRRSRRLSCAVRRRCLAALCGDRAGALRYKIGYLQKQGDRLWLTRRGSASCQRGDGCFSFDSPCRHGENVWRFLAASHASPAEARGRVGLPRVMWSRSAHRSFLTGRWELPSLSTHDTVTPLSPRRPRCFDPPPRRRTLRPASDGLP